MKTKIINLINLILFLVSIFYIVKIVNENYDHLKNSLSTVEFKYIIILLFLSILNNSFANILNFVLSMRFTDLNFNKFTEINLISNLINHITPFFGTLYKGYIFKKFNYSYFNFINVLILLRILQVYLVFILSLLLFMFIEEKLLSRLIILSIIIIQIIIFFYLKSIKLKKKYLQNKYIKKFKFFFDSFKQTKKKIFINLLAMRISDFSIFYILVNFINPLDIKIIIIIYILRFFINHLPLISNAATAVAVSTFVFSFLSLNIMESFFINFMYGIIIILGTVICLIFNFIYKIYKQL